MTTIRTTCTLCGDVELSPSDLHLDLAVDHGSGTYSFTCPYCGNVEHRPASHRVVSILLATGVAYEVAATTGDRITDDEIEAFRLALDQPDWFSHLGAS